MCKISAYRFSAHPFLILILASLFLFPACKSNTDSRYSLPERLPSIKTELTDVFDVPMSEERKAYENEVAGFEKEDNAGESPKGGVIFTGGDLVYNWKGLEKDLSGLPIMVRGLKGSRLDQLAYYGPRFLIAARPSIVVVGGGEVEIVESGKGPYDLLFDIQLLFRVVNARLPETQYVVLGVKKSEANRSHWANIDQYNQLVSNISNFNSLMVYVDLNSICLSEDGGIKTGSFSGKEAKFSSKAYHELAILLKPILEPPFLKPQ